MKTLTTAMMTKFKPVWLPPFGTTISQPTHFYTLDEKIFICQPADSIDNAIEIINHWNNFGENQGSNKQILMSHSNENSEDIIERKLQSVHSSFTIIIIGPDEYPDVFQTGDIDKHILIRKNRHGQFLFYALLNFPRETTSASQLQPELQPELQPHLTLHQPIQVQNFNKTYNIVKLKLIATSLQSIWSYRNFSTDVKAIHHIDPQPSTGFDNRFLENYKESIYLESLYSQLMEIEKVKSIMLNDSTGITAFNFRTGYFQNQLLFAILSYQSEFETNHQQLFENVCDVLVNILLSRFWIMVAECIIFYLKESQSTNVNQIKSILAEMQNIDKNYLSASVHEQIVPCLNFEKKNIVKNVQDFVQSNEYQFCLEMLKQSDLLYDLIVRISKKEISSSFVGTFYNSAVDRSKKECCNKVIKQMIEVTKNADILQSVQKINQSFFSPNFTELIQLVTEMFQENKTNKFESAPSTTMCFIFVILNFVLSEICKFQFYLQDDGNKLNVAYWDYDYWRNHNFDDDSESPFENFVIVEDDRYAKLFSDQFNPRNQSISLYDNITKNQIFKTQHRYPSSCISVYVIDKIDKIIEFIHSKIEPNQINKSLIKLYELTDHILLHVGFLMTEIQNLRFFGNNFVIFTLCDILKCYHEVFVVNSVSESTIQLINSFLNKSIYPLIDNKNHIFKSHNQRLHSWYVIVFFHLILYLFTSFVNGFQDDEGKENEEQEKRIFEFHFQTIISNIENCMDGTLQDKLAIDDFFANYPDHSSIGLNLEQSIQSLNLPPEYKSMIIDDFNLSKLNNMAKIEGELYIHTCLLFQQQTVQSIIDQQKNTEGGESSDNDSGGESSDNDSGSDRSENESSDNESSDNESSDNESSENESSDGSGDNGSDEEEKKDDREDINDDDKQILDEIRSTISVIQLPKDMDEIKLFIQKYSNFDPDRMTKYMMNEVDKLIKQKGWKNISMNQKKLMIKYVLFDVPFLTNFDKYFDLYKINNNCEFDLNQYNPVFAPLKGIHNPSVFCFLISAFQALLSCTKVIENIGNKSSEEKQLMTGGERFFKFICDLILSNSSEDQTELTEMFMNQVNLFIKKVWFLIFIHNPQIVLKEVDDPTIITEVFKRAKNCFLNKIIEDDIAPYIDEFSLYQNRLQLYDNKMKKYQLEVDRLKAIKEPTKQENSLLNSNQKTLDDMVRDKDENTIYEQIKALGKRLLDIEDGMYDEDKISEAVYNEYRSCLYNVLEQTIKQHDTAFAFFEMIEMFNIEKFFEFTECITNQCTVCKTVDVSRSPQKSTRLIINNSYDLFQILTNGKKNYEVEYDSQQNEFVIVPSLKNIRCTRCGKNTISWQTTFFIFTSPYLAIEYKHYSTNKNKIKSFPQKVKMNKYPQQNEPWNIVQTENYNIMNQPACIPTQSPQSFHLIAQVNHDGSICELPGKQCSNETRGHYYSFCRRFGNENNKISNKVYKFNDSKCTESAFDQQTTQTKLLIYALQNDEIIKNNENESKYAGEED